MVADARERRGPDRRRPRRAALPAGGADRSGAPGRLRAGPPRRRVRAALGRARRRRQPVERLVAAGLRAAARPECRDAAGAAHLAGPRRRDHPWLRDQGPRRPEGRRFAAGDRGAGRRRAAAARGQGAGDPCARRNRRPAIRRRADRAPARRHPGPAAPRGHGGDRRDEPAGAGRIAHRLPRGTVAADAGGRAGGDGPQRRRLVHAGALGTRQRRRLERAGRAGDDPRHALARGRRSPPGATGRRCRRPGDRRRAAGDDDAEDGRGREDLHRGARAPGSGGADCRRQGAQRAEARGCCRGAGQGLRGLGRRTRLCGASGAAGGARRGGRPGRRASPDRGAVRSRLGGPGPGCGAAARGRQRRRSRPVRLRPTPTRRSKRSTR